MKFDKKITIGRLFADRSYNRNNIFRQISNNGILPCIKVRKMLESDGKKETYKETSVLAQSINLQRCKDSVIYGQRWIVETMFLYEKKG